MTGFSVHTGKVAVLEADHVDTDRIIPARFLSMVTRSGYGELLFSDVRGGDFILDRPEAQGASVLVVGTNFGCGSSREHAVWAIQQAGFVAVVARKESDSPGFSDIFRQNAANCGLLLIELLPEAHSRIVRLGTGAEVTVDLLNQQIAGESFEILPATKEQLVRGLDLIGTTMDLEDSITSFEGKHDPIAPVGTSV